MGHHNLDNFTYQGADEATLKKLVEETIRDHTEEEGSFHSVDSHYEILSGVTTENAFLSSNDGATGVAQQLYSPKDLTEKTMKVIIPVASMEEADLYSPTVQRVIESKIRSAGGFLKSLRPVLADRQVARGVSGSLKVKKWSSAEPLVNEFILLDGDGNPLRNGRGYPTRKEAEDAAKDILTGAIPYMGKVPESIMVHLQRVRMDTSPVSILSRELVRGKVTVEVTYEVPRRGAKPAGWVVSLDCHH